MAGKITIYVTVKRFCNKFTKRALSYSRQFSVFNEHGSY